MNKPLTLTSRRSRVRPKHLAPRRAAIPARRLLGTCPATVVLVTACGGSDDDTTADQAALVEQGRQIFRYETFGDEEANWTDSLRMHEVTGAAVDPVTALSVGLKVDAQALPAAVVDGI